MLKGITVIDIAHVFPGHFAGQILADLGAKVIKIEDPLHPDLLRKFTPRIGTESAFFLAVNRNKKSLCVDIKTPKGKEIFKKLAEKADVVIDNFRPGFMQALGLGYQELKNINPGLIYCNITAFGSNSKASTRGAHDLNFIAESGILAATSAKDGTPVMPGVSIGAFSGGFYATIAILAALYKRSLTGIGSHIETSVFDGLLQMSSIAASKIDPSLNEQMPINNYIYRTKDNRYVALAAIEKKFWLNFINTIGRADLEKAHGTKAVADNPYFKELTAIFLAKTQQEWCSLLENVDCCFSPVLNFEQALSTKYVQEKNLAVTIFHKLIGNIEAFPLPVLFNPSPDVTHNAPPLIGEHSQEILKELGYTNHDIKMLIEENIIK